MSVRGAPRNFAYGEYTHILRLTSELVDLRVGYANRATRPTGGTHRAVLKLRAVKERKKHLRRGAPRNFACGEYTHTLRLTSELVDLRVGYANRATRPTGGTHRAVLAR